MAPPSSHISPEIFNAVPELTAAISTRQGGEPGDSFGMNLSYNVGDEEERVARNRVRFFSSLNVPQEALAFPRQVHSGVVRLVRSPGPVPDCDAVMTDALGLFLAISVADCLPILLADPVRHAIAAVHSGWRGSAQKIAASAVRLLKAELGSEPRDILAYLGPSAGVCCYEVSSELAGEFDPAFVRKSEGKARPHLDLKELNRNLLVKSGLRVEHIEVSPHCTICSPALFHSYRRDGKKSGRMLAVIGMH